MRSSMFAVGVAATMAAAFAIPSALQAHDTSSPRGEGNSMMGPSILNNMGQMMDHCSQMMQGASSRPNDQWRDNSPPASGGTEKKQ
jgi:hypothetical protein